MSSAHPTKQRMVFAVTAIAIVLTDQATKSGIRMTLEEGQWRSVIPGFMGLTYRLNQGIAFSFFHTVNAAPIVFSLIALAAVVGMCWLVYRHPRLPGKVITALGMIAGGAAGNMIDRITPPHKVLDFIDCYINGWHWPAFNIADSAICIGAGLLILSSFTDPQAFSHPAPGGQASGEKASDS